MYVRIFNSKYFKYPIFFYNSYLFRMRLPQNMIIIDSKRLGYCQMVNGLNCKAIWNKMTKLSTQFQLRILFNNLWLRALDAEERAASRAKYWRPSLRLERKHEVKEGHAAEEEWTGYVLIQIMKPKPTCATWKEKNATAGITLNGIEDNFLLIIILMLKLKLNMLGNRLCT